MELKAEPSLEQYELLPNNSYMTTKGTVAGASGNFELLLEAVF